MAESCSNGQLVIPDCKTNTLSLSGIKMNLENNTSIDVEFNIKSAVNSFCEKWKVVEANTTTSIQFDDYIYEGATFLISVENPSTDDVLVEGEIDLTFNREESNSWAINRNIGITPTDEGYAINF